MTQYFAQSYSEQKRWYNHGSDSSEHMYSREYRRQGHSHSPPRQPYENVSPTQQESEVQFVNGTAYFPQPSSSSISTTTHFQSRQYSRRGNEKQAVTFSGQHIVILPSARNFEVSPNVVQMLA
eukprot:484584_1